MTTQGMGFSRLLRQHALAASLIVLFCSVSVRVFMASREDPRELVEFYSDARTYLGPATSLIDRGAFLNDLGLPEVYRTPGYPLFLAGIMMVTGAGLRGVLLAQAAILSAGPLILYLLAKRILPPAPAFVGSLIAAISPWGSILATVPLSDGLFLTLLTLVFLLMKITADSVAARAAGASVALGLVTGIAVLVRPIWPVAILVPVAFLLYAGSGRNETRLLVIAMLVCALAPAAFWRERNKREAHFASISGTPGETAWHYLAARVRAKLSDQDRFSVISLAAAEEHSWGVPRSVQELDDERWSQAAAVFEAHPFVTAFAFTLSAFEHAVHPSPDVLIPPKLSFRGDYVVLATAWGALLLMAAYGLSGLSWASRRFGNQVDCRLIVAVLVICLLITLSSGISFGAGSRLRAPMEAIVPLLAALGLSRMADHIRRFAEPV